MKYVLKLSLVVLENTQSWLGKIARIDFTFKKNIILTLSLFRPPFGNCNEACAKVLQGEMNLTVIQWNCDSNDWRFTDSVADQPKTFTNIANIINPSNPKTDSFITLQHDTKEYSVGYVPKIIELVKD